MGVTASIIVAAIAVDRVARRGKFSLGIPISKIDLAALCVVEFAFWCEILLFYGTKKWIIQDVYDSSNHLIASMFFSPEYLKLSYFPPDGRTSIGTEPLSGVKLLPVEDENFFGPAYVTSLKEYQRSILQTCGIFEALGLGLWVLGSASTVMCYSTKAYSRKLNVCTFGIQVVRAALWVGLVVYLGTSLMLLVDAYTIIQNWRPPSTTQSPSTLRPVSRLNYVKVIPGVLPMFLIAGAFLLDWILFWHHRETGKVDCRDIDNVSGDTHVHLLDDASQPNPPPSN